jgi:hypothetical protein
MSLTWDDEVKLFADAMMEWGKTYDYAVYDLRNELLRRMYKSNIPETEMSERLGKHRNTIRRWAELGGFYD